MNTKSMLVQSPNLSIRPTSTLVNQEGHLCIGGLDTVMLAERFDTPLWIIDEKTILDAIAAYQKGLSIYPNSLILYAGKAFLCLAMCHLLAKLGLGLDVVSQGELHTARAASFPPSMIYMHGNNKSESEIRQGLAMGNVKIVVDNYSELLMVAAVANEMKRKANILLRITPNVEPNTHQYTKTGQADSKFGFPLVDLPQAAKTAISLGQEVKLIGLHAHIGSQCHEIQPYLDIIEVLADCYLSLKSSFNYELQELDVGGGLGIAYTEFDQPVSILEWSNQVATTVMSAFKSRSLKLPKLLVEPGRTIIGTAGITLYKAGHKKKLPSGLTYLAVDGGMADNPRPITYQASYSACIANRMFAKAPPQPITLVGKYCESGDIIVKDVYLAAETGDIIAIFGTGAYNFSQASNYNRTGRPACILVSEGVASIIVKRETYDDLLRQDRVPERLLS